MLKNLFIGTIIGIILAGLIMAGVGYFLFNRPLAPTLKLIPAQPAIASAETPDTEPGVAQAGESGAEIEPVEPLKEPSETEVALLSPEPPVPVRPACGTGAMTILMIGEGSPHPDERQGADAIRLLRIDFDYQEVTILSIPEDLWVKTSPLTGFDHNTLTRAYYEFRYATGGSNREAIQIATQVIAQALLDNFGFVPDHYLTINEPVFVSLVDTLGGIELNIKERVDGSAEGRGVFEKGRQILNGNRTLDYIRIKNPNNKSQSDEWSRFERQNQVLSAIQNEITKPENAAAMPSLINEFYQLVVTDLNPFELLNLNCMVDAVGDNINMLHIDSDMVSTDSQGHLIPNETKIRNLIETHFSK